MYNVHLCGELNHNYGKKLSEETKKKISNSHKKLTGILASRSKPVQASTGEKFVSMSEAIKWCGLKSVKSIALACKGKSKTAGKHPITNEKLSWKFLDK